jgi:hypothetical protein
LQKIGIWRSPGTRTLHRVPDQRDRITEAADIIASWTRVWSQLLAAHVAGPDGRCRGCAVDGRIAPRWPCRLADLASTAQRIHRSRALRN